MCMSKSIRSGCPGASPLGSRRRSESAQDDVLNMSYTCGWEAVKQGSEISFQRLQYQHDSTVQMVLTRQ